MNSQSFNFCSRIFIVSFLLLLKIVGPFNVIFAYNPPVEMFYILARWWNWDQNLIFLGSQVKLSLQNQLRCKNSCPPTKLHTNCGFLRWSHKRQACTSHKLLIMAEVIRRRDCCLTSLPNILERSGLMTTNSEAWRTYRNCEKVCIICLPKSLEKSGTGKKTINSRRKCTGIIQLLFKSDTVNLKVLSRSLTWLYSD